jgi:PAS domain S-box-containing protein
MIQKKAALTNGPRPAGISDNAARMLSAEGAELYAQIIEGMPVALDVWHLEDADDPGSLRLILSNSAAGHFTGVPREDVLGRTLAESYPATFAIGGPRLLAKVIRSGKARHLGEVRYGDERIPQAVFSLTAFPLPNNCVGLAFENITERKRAEEALRRSEATYRSIFNAATDGILIHDMEAGEIVDANAVVRDLFGYTPEEARRLRVEDLSSGDPPYTQKDALRWIHKAARGQPQRFEWRAKDRDGRLFWVDVTLKRATIAGQNRVLAITRDITKRKEAEEALRREKDRAQQYLDVAGVIFVAIDPDERVSLVNIKGCELLGYEAGEIIGKNWFSTFLPARIRERVRAVFSRMVAGDMAPVEYFENPVVSKTGEERIIAWHNALLRDEAGTISGTLSSGVDVTERKQAEEALRTSEETYRSIFNATNDGIIVLDIETGKIVDANATFCNVFGYAPEEARGLRVGDFSSGQPAYTQEDALRLIQKAVRGEPQRFEWLAKSRDGRLSWIDVTLKRATIAGQDRMLAIGRDITQRKQAEEALRESERRFRKLSDATFEGIAIHRKGTILDANQALATMFGYEPSDVIDMHALDLTAPEFRDSFSQRMASGYQEPFETVGLKRDGCTFPCEIWCKPMPWQGQTVTVAAVRDITERKQAEEALRESERRFRTLSEASFEGIAIHHRGTILEANQAFATMFGYELSEVMGMHALDFAAAESRDLLLHHIVSAYQQPFEGTGLRKDGTTFPVEVCGRPIPYQGRMATVAALRDLTERKRMEEALEEAREELEARVDRQMERGNFYGLTFRELTVLHLVAAGKADKEIGSQLGVSPLTASKHLANILSKMSAASRTEACVRALREGLLD